MVFEDAKQPHQVGPMIIGNSWATDSQLIRLHLQMYCHLESSLLSWLAVPVLMPCLQQATLETGQEADLREKITLILSPAWLAPVE